MPYSHYHGGSHHTHYRRRKWGRHYMRHYHPHRPQKKTLSAPIVLTLIAAVLWVSLSFYERGPAALNMDLPERVVSMLGALMQGGTPPDPAIEESQQGQQRGRTTAVLTDAPSPTAALPPADTPSPTGTPQPAVALVSVSTSHSAPVPDSTATAPQPTVTASLSLPPDTPTPTDTPQPTLAPDSRAYIHSHSAPGTQLQRPGRQPRPGQPLRPRLRRRLSHPINAIMLKRKPCWS